MEFQRNRSGDKILLTGVCYVHRLLELRFRADAIPASRDYIRYVHPDFDVGRVDFFRPGIEEKFLFTDFHGKTSSIATEADNLPELLNLYHDKCRLMYVVGATGINLRELPAVKASGNYSKLSAFWYFLFDENWNPRSAEVFEDRRDMAILALLRAHPHLKFIFYQRSCLNWWRKMGLPGDRLLYWEIDWGMTGEEFRELNSRGGGLPSGHRFPTEQSYNDLCELILRDEAAV